MSRPIHYWNPRLSRSAYNPEAECGARDSGGVMHEQSIEHVTCTPCLLALGKRAQAQADELLDKTRKRIEELTKEQP